MKIKVHTTETLRRKVSEYVSQRQVAADMGPEASGAYGRATKTERTYEVAEFDGQLEVYLDMKKLLETYADTAFRNKQHRFIRGPIEVRVVGMKEVPGSRKQEVR